MVMKAIRRTDKKKHPVQLKTLRLLLGNLAANVVACCWCGVMAYGDLSDPLTCSYFGRLGGRCVHAYACVARASDSDSQSN
jgi:hypothetical protein